MGGANTTLSIEVRNSRLIDTTSIGALTGHIIWQLVTDVPDHHLLSRLRSLHDGTIRAWMTASRRSIDHRHLATIGVLSVLLGLLETRYWSSQGSKLRKLANARLRCFPPHERHLLKGFGESP